MVLGNDAVRAKHPFRSFFFFFYIFLLLKNGTHDACNSNGTFHAILTLHTGLVTFVHYIYNDNHTKTGKALSEAKKRENILPIVINVSSCLSYPGTFFPLIFLFLLQ